MITTVASKPLNTRAKVLVLLLLASLCAMWILSFNAYSRLPDEVPTHFGVSGKPDAYGTRSSFLVLPLIFSIAPVIILLFVRLRFTLINKYPFLINLPAFYIHLDKIPGHRRAIWVNRYFELIAALGLCLTLYLILLLLGIYSGSSTGALPSWFPVAAFALPVGLIVPFVYALYRLSKSMQTEISDGEYP